MTQSLHPAAEKGFGVGASLYQNVRPDYPQAITAWLKDTLGLQTNDLLLDLGAGTGKFLPYLQAISEQIYAADPVEAMLTQLRLHHPDVHTLQAMSDQLPIANDTVRAIFCAQSFHWFATLDTLAELHRVLQSHGHLVLIWNQRDVSVDWVKALADEIFPLEGDTPRYHSGEWQKVFSQQDYFQQQDQTTFRQLHHGTVEQVVSKRLLSTSFIAALPEPAQQRLKQRFEHIVYDYTGKQAQDEIDFPYTTYVYVFKKND
jgi:ubiquinone/menaquinone biosynthesis C-methylase UbiE